jgi:hypothetical protein
VNTAFHTTTTILSGNRIEVIAPEMREGDRVDVVVTPASSSESAPKTGPSIFEIVASLKGRRLFQSVEEVDRYINEERDSWDR